MEEWGLLGASDWLYKGIPLGFGVDRIQLEIKQLYCRIYPVDAELKEWRPGSRIAS